MTRRRKSRGPSPVVTLLLAAVVMFLGFWYFSGKGDPGSFRTVEELDPALYYDNANSLRGNTYRIDAEIGSALGNSAAKGRLFSVMLNKAAKAGEPVILPVLVPLSLGSLTIQKGQHYLMKVKVGENGLLIVEEAVKP